MKSRAEPEDVQKTCTAEHLFYSALACLGRWSVSARGGARGGQHGRGEEALEVRPARVDLRLHRGGDRQIHLEPPGMKKAYHRTR